MANNKAGLLMDSASKRHWKFVRGPWKTQVYGALRVRDGKELTRYVASRNSTNSSTLIQDNEADNLRGDIFIITDNLSSHSSDHILPG